MDRESQTGEKKSREENCESSLMEKGNRTSRSDDFSAFVPISATPGKGAGKYENSFSRNVPEGFPMFFVR